MGRKSLKKEEKIVLIFGLFAIIVLLVVGIYKKQTTVVEPLEINETSSSITTTKNQFKFEIGSKIPDNVDYYLNNVNPDEWQIDLSDVVNTEIGSYQILFTKDDLLKKVIVSIADTKAPKITLEHSKVEWDLTQSDDVRDLAQYVNANAMDEADGDVTNYIVGWPKQLPEKEGTYKYTLRVRDKARNIAQEVLTVHFYR